MEIFVTTENGYLADKYSKYAKDHYAMSGLSIHSFPITWSDLPEGTKSLALTFIDYDAVPVCGFPWIHWIVADMPVDIQLVEGVSRSGRVIEGANSLLAEEASSMMVNGYVGPAPPDKDHVYTLQVFALDTVLNLEEGFYLNELYKAMDGHILADKICTILGRV